MKVLITGGSGTLGKEIANLVFKKKYEVNILTRNKNLKSHNPQLKYYYWNPKKEDIDLDCFNNVDCVINLAGFSVFSLWTKANKTKIFESRVGSTNFILDVILKKNITIGWTGTHSSIEYLYILKNVFKILKKNTRRLTLRLFLILFIS